MSNDDLIRRGDALALPHKLSPSLDADDGYFVSVDAIRALPAAPTFTAADVDRAYRLALADAAHTAFRRYDAGNAILKMQVPADLAQRVKE